MSDKTKLALRPYIEAVEERCRPLTRDELLRIVLSLAKEAPASERAAFLACIAAAGKPVAESAISGETEGVRELLQRVESLESDIIKRIESIEDGSYWDEEYEYDGHNSYDDEAEALSDDQKAEFVNCFAEADRIFLHHPLKDARAVYGRLLEALKAVEDHNGGWIDIDVDLREVRARYCRCVYELTALEKRLPAMLEAMQVEAHGRIFDDAPRDYPMLQDVIDAQAGAMSDFDSFLVDWEKALVVKGFENNRLAGLRLEDGFMSGGVVAVAVLARQWKDKQPKGYLNWCARLKADADWPALESAAREALDNLPRGRDRGRIADYLIDAGRQLQNASAVLEGKRERFVSVPGVYSLLSLVAEAEKQKVRAEELLRAVRIFEALKQEQHFDAALYAQALLMAGHLGEAINVAQKEKEIGWSYGSSAGVVFAAVLHLVCGGSEARLIRELLDEYADSQRISFDDLISQEDVETTMPQEIRKGLTLAAPGAAELAEYYKWAQTIGEKRVNHIVSKKHRGAYDRAAHVLAALAEARCVHSGQSEAVYLLREYYQARYNRYPAFRKELKDVVTRSSLLKVGFLS